jgi:hypothetical protein
MLSVAAKNGAILAGEKGPAVGLRRGSFRVLRGMPDSFKLPCGNFGCPTATGSHPFRVGPQDLLSSSSRCPPKSSADRIR